ncbi:MAG TPA: hypothetical protein VFO35_06725 [Steroidobacteraceae bacterium]|nr:hypothetical protein [Steroidobacteraceae bacterium]
MNDFPTQAAAFLGVATESTRSISNVTTQIDSVGSGRTLLPVTINSCEPDNSWVCSPHTAYYRYAIEELHRFGHPLFTRPLGFVCRSLGAYLRSRQIDQAVAVNNWLLSTNLYPSLDLAALKARLDEAVQRWPQHAIWFRSLNPRYTKDWLDALEAAGCTLIPSRQVYLYDRIDLGGLMPKDLSRDLRLLRSTPLARDDAKSWSASDFDRAADLYAQLYLQKYSRLNPAYSAQFLQAWQRAGLLQLVGYRDAEGMLQAVVGLFAIDCTITVPIVGYATQLPQKLGLYRLLMATAYEAAAATRARINLSAGAAEFKRWRGGIGTMEYSAVYARHLNRKRRRAIDVLAMLAKRIGEPIMQRFQL